MVLTSLVCIFFHSQEATGKLNNTADGTTPTDIAEGTGSAVPSLSSDIANGVLPMPSGAFLGVTFASLATVLSAFAVLA